MCGQKSEAIMRVDQGYSGGDACKGGRGAWGEDARSDACDVGGEAIDTMSIYPSEVCGDEAMGDYLRVGRRNSVGYEERDREF